MQCAGAGWKNAPALELLPANKAEGKVMYAVVETGGKQYKVSAGETIEVEKLPLRVGQQVELDRVLLVSDEKVRVGNPTIEGAKVMATVAGQGKGKKVIVFKYKPRNRYRRKAGHRQAYTRLRIDKIII
jgi:large subunit ribosomal protein L21